MIWGGAGVQEKGDFLPHHRRRMPVDEIGSWDEGNIGRLIGAFLRARLPMDLDLNKSNLPLAALITAYMKDALPIHGSHVGVPVLDREEIGFLQRHIVR